MFTKERLQEFDLCFIPRKDLDDIEEGLVGNMNVLQTIRHRFRTTRNCVDYLSILFDDFSKIEIYAEDVTQ